MGRVKIKILHRNCKYMEKLSNNKAVHTLFAHKYKAIEYITRKLVEEYNNVD